jgi:hypothetical protein
MSEETPHKGRAMATDRLIRITAQMMQECARETCTLSSYPYMTNGGIGAYWDTPLPSSMTREEAEAEGLFFGPEPEEESAWDEEPEDLLP